MKYIASPLFFLILFSLTFNISHAAITKCPGEAVSVNWSTTNCTTANIIISTISGSCPLAPSVQPVSGGSASLGSSLSAGTSCSASIACTSPSGGNSSDSFSIASCSCAAAPTNATLYGGANQSSFTYPVPSSSYSASDTATKCEWSCNSGFNYSAGTCVAAVVNCTSQAKTWNTNCTGTVAATNSGNISAAVTNTAAGYYGSATFSCSNGVFTTAGTSCTVCTAGSYCPAGGGGPIQCPADNYCPAGSPSPTPCTSGWTSPAGSSNSGQCTAPAGPACGTSNNGAAVSSQPSGPTQLCSNGAFGEAADSGGYFRWTCGGSASCQVAQLCGSTQYWNGASCTSCTGAGCTGCLSSPISSTYNGCSCNGGVGTPPTCTATDSCGAGSGATPQLSEPVGASACSVGSLNSSSPADTVTSGAQAWNWSCGTVTSCSAPKYGCRTATDSNYTLPQYGANGPNNTYGCAGTCANGNTNYPTCTPLANDCPAGTYANWNVGGNVCNGPSPSAVSNGGTISIPNITGGLTGTGVVMCMNGGFSGALPGSTCSPTVATGLSVDPATCTIPFYGTYCTHNVTWNTTDPTSYPQKINSDNTPYDYWYFAAPSRTIGIDNKPVGGIKTINLISSGVNNGSQAVNAVCAGGLHWSSLTQFGFCTDNTPQILAGSSGCKITGTGSSCNIDLTWFLSNITSFSLTDAVGTVLSTETQSYPGYPGYGHYTSPMTYGSYTYHFKDNGTTLKSATVAVTCDTPNGFSWDAANGKCAVMCAVDKFAIPIGANSYICAACPANSTSAGGAVSSCTCSNGFHWDPTTYTCVVGSTPTATLDATPRTCSITLGYGTCPVSFTWTTTNPITTSQVDPDLNPLDNLPGPTSSLSNGTTETLNVRRTGPTGQVFWVYNNSLPLVGTNVTIVADCSPSTQWDTTNSVCADPQVSNPSASGQHYYSSPEAINFVCTNSTHYKLTKGATTYGPYAYVGPVSFDTSLPGRGSGNYNIYCIHGSIESSPYPQAYDSTAPAIPDIFIDAYPKTINANGKSVISWSITRPRLGAPFCEMTASAVCTNGSCTQAQTQAAQQLQNTINTGKIDGSNTITIVDAVKSIAQGQVGTDAKALGKKTFTASTTADFTITCGAQSATTRVRVANSKEQ